MQAPPEVSLRQETAHLNGPVTNAEGRSDVMANQSEVEDPLAGMGF